MKKLFKYLKPYAVFAVLSPLFMIGEVTADLMLPYLMSYIVDYGIYEKDIYDPESGSKVAYTVMEALHGESFTPIQTIVTFGILMLVITLIGGFFGTVCAYTASKAGQSAGHDLRTCAYKKVMSLSVEQTDKFTTGSLVTRMTNDISVVVDFFEMLLRMFVRAPMFLIGGTVMLVLLDLKFSAILLCSIPVLAIVLITVLLKAIPLYSKVQQRLDKVNSVVQENVSGARVVKAYVKEDYECERFNGANSALFGVNLKVLKLMAVIPPVLTVILNISIVAVIYIGGFNIYIENASMTTGAIMAAITYMTMVLNSIMMVTNMFQSVSRANASAKRINELLESDPVIISSNRTYGENSDIAVSFKNVSFHYPSTVGRPVLNNISLDIKRGETLAIIGSTGCGKTSLASLIPRFYDAVEGTVYVDGVPVKDYDLDALRSKISYVMQKSELFSDTIEGNIRWGDENATQEMLEKAIDISQAKEFIDSFALGMNTKVAEKGASLSGGQKQRISIARGIIRKPDILIFDDATSALDLATEGKLRRAMKEHLDSTTVIMIAQRIASVMEADRIAVIENDGTIKHCAPHSELLKTSQTYKDIYDSQIRSGAFAIEEA